jgi:hypothetical protein
VMIGLWLSGKLLPSLATFAKLAAALDVEVVELEPDEEMRAVPRDAPTLTPLSYPKDVPANADGAQDPGVSGGGCVTALRICRRRGRRQPFDRRRSQVRLLTPSASQGLTAYFLGRPPSLPFSVGERTTSGASAGEASSLAAARAASTAARSRSRAASILAIRPSVSPAMRSSFDAQMGDFASAFDPWADTRPFYANRPFTTKQRTHAGKTQVFCNRMSAEEEGSVPSARYRNQEQKSDSDPGRWSHLFSSRVPVPTLLYPHAHTGIDGASQSRRGPSGAGTFDGDGGGGKLRSGW